MHLTRPRQTTAEASTPPAKNPAEDLLDCPLPEVYRRLHTSAEGLSSEEARRRLKTVGPNEPASTPQAAGIVQFLRLFLSPLVIILLIASIVAAVLGEVLNAGIIV